MMMTMSLMFLLCCTVSVQAQNVKDKVDDNIIPAMEQYEDFDFGKIKIDNNLISSYAVEGDVYGENNGSGIATDGRYNKLSFDTIHDENDVDWYALDVSSSSEPISVMLANIPNGCDYDLFIVKYDSTNGITELYHNLQAGTTSEALYGTLPAGKYYVVVQADPDVVNNYSDSNYKLYFGDYFVYGTYGYVDTGLDIDFGYVKPGNTTPVSRGWYTYDLTNNSQIPDDAMAEDIYLSSDGNGNSWIGFTKRLRANGSQTTFPDKTGGISVMFTYNPEENERIPVKQQWLIGGYLTSSTYFIWEPRIRFVYQFSATLDNIYYLH